MHDHLLGTKILYAGQYWPGSNTVYIARAFQKLGIIVRWFNDIAIFPRWSTFHGKVIRRILFPSIVAEWNRQFLEAFKSFQPDLVYIAMGDLCTRDTIEEIKKHSVPVVCFYHDVRWKNKPYSLFENSISHYDLVATTRSWQEAEFREVGVRNVVLTRFGFDPEIHRPVPVSSRIINRFGADVTFVGTNEPYRARQLSMLMTSSPTFSFRLWGGGWNRLPPSSPLAPFWQGREVYEQEIPVIYAAGKVALHWVGWEPDGKEEQMSKGDQHNSRTFQIAACEGAIMVAQRTDEHEELFLEDKEAIFFDSVDELKDKLTFWLNPDRDDARRKIAVAARARCLREDYSYIPVAFQFLNGVNLC